MKIPTGSLSVSSASGKKILVYKRLHALGVGEEGICCSWGEVTSALMNALRPACEVIVHAHLTSL
jgi:hypothetical protein